MKNAWLMMGLAVLALSLAGCGSGQTEQETQAPARMDDGEGHSHALKSIVATVGMVADIVDEVAGGHAQVSHLIGSGIDPHLYQPTRSDVLKLMNADMVFYVGLRLEGKMGTELRRIGEEKPVVPVASRLDAEFLLAEPDDPDSADPHVWMDVKGWMKAVEVVRDALIEADPSHTEIYTENAADLLARLETLDQYAQQVLSSIPEEQRVMITAHDAFRYLGRAYEIEVRGIQGLSTESEAGLQDVNRLVDLIVERDIGAIFVESSVADKNVQALIEGAKSRGKKVVIGGTLYSDAMGPKGTYEGTYIGMIDHNVTTIARALGGEAPAGGMQGKLAGAGSE